MSARAELASFLLRLAETLSFARLLEERPELRPGDLRRLLQEAAGQLEGRAGVEGGAPARAGSSDEEDGPETLDLDLEDLDPAEPQLPRPTAAGETVATLLVDVHVDGASKGNPGPSSVGYVIAEPGGLEFVAEGHFIGKATNNEAEYRALLRALEAAERHGFRRLKIHSDSQLLIRQLQGTYKVNNPQLRALHEKARERLAGFEQFELHHIPREQNQRADALANAAIKAVLKRQKAAAKRKALPTGPLP